MMRTLDRIPIHLPPAPIRGEKDAMLARAGEHGWTLEAKVDGCRALIFKHPDGTTDIYNRHGDLMTARGGRDAVRRLTNSFPAGMALEGEYVRASGRLYLFDLTWATTALPAAGVGCVCLFRRPHAERRMLLDLLVSRHAGPGCVTVPNALYGFRQAYCRWRRQDCEGVVAKRRTAPYGGTMVGKTPPDDPAWRKWRFEWDEELDDWSHEAEYDDEDCLIVQEGCHDDSV